MYLLIIVVVVMIHALQEAWSAKDHDICCIFTVYDQNSTVIYCEFGQYFLNQLLRGKQKMTVITAIIGIPLKFCSHWSGMC